MSRYHDEFLAGHFSIKKTPELVAHKYYLLTFWYNVKGYVKAYDVCLASKAIKHKLCSDFEAGPIPTHYWKDQSIDFMTSLPFSINWKREAYEFILVIIDWLRKMVYFKRVKISINALRFAEIIVEIVVKEHDLSDTIVSDSSFPFTFKFWSLLH